MEVKEDWGVRGKGSDTDEEPNNEPAAESKKRQIQVEMAPPAPSAVPAKIETPPTPASRPKQPEQAPTSANSQFYINLRPYDIVQYHNSVTNQSHFTVIFALVTGFSASVKVSEDGTHLIYALTSTAVDGLSYMNPEISTLAGFSNNAEASALYNYYHNKPIECFVVHIPLPKKVLCSPIHS